MRQLESVPFSPLNGASLMILAYFVMELQLHKHTLLPAQFYSHVWLTLAPSSEGLRSPNAANVFIVIPTFHRLWQSAALKLDGELHRDCVGVTIAN